MAEAKTKPNARIESEEPVEKKYRCVVHRLNTERENADLRIAVRPVGKKPRIFDPGEKVVLYERHINILKNAVDSTEIELPPESGVYESDNPLLAAERNFPGFQAKLRDTDGMIVLTKDLPMYAVEIQSEVK